MLSESCTIRDAQWIIQLCSVNHVQSPSFSTCLYAPFGELPSTKTRHDPGEREFHPLSKNAHPNVLRLPVWRQERKNGISACCCYPRSRNNNKLTTTLPLPDQLGGWKFFLVQWLNESPLATLHQNPPIRSPARAIRRSTISSGP